MEYKNNWPVYVQKDKPVKGLAVVGSISGTCVGGSSDSTVNKLDVALARAECNRKSKQKAALPLDIVMNKLISMQRSSDLNLACRARKAAAELANVRKNLAFKCTLLKKSCEKDASLIMAIENRKALASFKLRWANLLGFDYEH